MKALNEFKYPNGWKEYWASPGTNDSVLGALVIDPVPVGGPPEAGAAPPEAPPPKAPPPKAAPGVTDDPGITDDDPRIGASAGRGCTHGTTALFLT